MNKSEKLGLWLMILSAPFMARSDIGLMIIALIIGLVGWTLFFYSGKEE